jgi:hypothetical protein
MHVTENIQGQATTNEKFLSRIIPTKELIMQMCNNSKYIGYFSQGPSWAKHFKEKLIYSSSSRNALLTTRGAPCKFANLRCNWTLWGLEHRTVYLSPAPTNYSVHTPHQLIRSDEWRWLAFTEQYCQGAHGTGMLNHATQRLPLCEIDPQKCKYKWARMEPFWKAFYLLGYNAV